MDSEELLAKIRDLEMAAAKSAVPPWAKIAIAVVLILLIGAGAAAGYYYLRHEHATIMTQEQIKHSAELAQKLDISQAQAKKLATELAAANNRDPDIRYIVQAPTVEQAAVQVKKDIDAGKSPANQIKANKTVVTPNVKEQKVDVYRITLDKARWGVSGLVLAGGGEAVEFGGGIAYHNKNWSAGAGGTNRGRGYVTATKYW